MNIIVRMKPYQRRKKYERLVSTVNTIFPSFFVLFFSINFTGKQRMILRIQLYINQIVL